MFHVISLHFRDAGLSRRRCGRTAGRRRLRPRDERSCSGDAPFGDILIDFLSAEIEAGADRSTGILRIDRLQKHLDKRDPFELIEVSHLTRRKRTKPSCVGKVLKRLGLQMNSKGRLLHRDAERLASWAVRAAVVLRFTNKGFIHLSKGVARAPVGKSNWRVNCFAESSTYAAPRSIRKLCHHNHLCAASCDETADEPLTCPIHWFYH